MANKHTINDLHQMQGLPLSIKIQMTKRRIKEWVEHFGLDGVHVSFSGGKDSTVLLDLARQEFPSIEAVFVDVPTQYPELKQFALTYDNVTVLKPSISFVEVCEKYGFPLISKEVSACVSGARKYLTRIKEQTKLDRQTDRQLPYKYYYEKVTGTGEYIKFSETPSGIVDNQAMLDFTRGGYDNKYRKLRGIGEYANKGKQTSSKLQRCNDDGSVRSGLGKEQKGEYP